MHRGAFPLLAFDPDAPVVRLETAVVIFIVRSEDCST